LGGSSTCTIGNDDNPAHLTLVKVVTNNNGGTATAANFPLRAAGPVTISGLTNAAAVTNATVNAGLYNLSETTLAGYTPSSWSCTSGGSGSTVTLALGGSSTCTIGNDDQPATLTVCKYVLGASSTFNFTSTGGLPSGGSFSLTPVANTCATPGGAGTLSIQTVFTGLSAGAYTVTEGTKASYVLTDLACDGVPGNLTTRTASTTLALGQSKTCTFTNQEQVGGTTRTQGFWATHFALTSAVMFGTEYPPGSGLFPYSGMSGADRTICGTFGVAGALTLTNINQVMGGFWAGISQTSTKDKRSSLDQARMQLLQQLLAAMLNHAAFNSSPSGSISIADAKAAFCGTDEAAIKAAQTAMAAFNEGGDSGVFTPGASADPKAAKAAALITFWDVLPPVNP
jgi:hypothetical protein